jgi:hypothetical protein
VADRQLLIRIQINLLRPQSCAAAQLWGVRSFGGTQLTAKQVVPSPSGF